MAKPNVVLLLAAIAGMVFIIFLNARYRKLSEEYLTLQQRFRERAAVRAGDVLPSLHLHGLDGEPRRVAFDNRDLTLVQVTSTTCAASGRFRREWWPELLADPQLSSHSPTTISIDSLEVTRSGLSEESLGGLVVTSDEPAVLRALRISSVPVIMLVDRDGVVIWLNNGLPDDGTVETLRATVAEFRARTYALNRL